MRSSTRFLLTSGRLPRRSRTGASKTPLRLPPRPPANGRLPWILALLCAAALHGVVIWPLFSGWIGTPSEAPVKTHVSSVSLSSKTFDANRRIAFDISKPPPPPPKQEKKKDPPVPPGQVVKVAPPPVEQRPEKADYVTDSSRKVDRETKARADAALPLNVTDTPKMGPTQKASPVPPKKTALLIDKSRSPGGRPADDTPAGRAGPLADPEAAGQTFVMEFARQRARPHLDLTLAEKATLQAAPAQEKLETNTERTRVALGNPSSPASTPSGQSGNLSGAMTPSGAGGEGLPNLADLTPTLSELVTAIGMPARNHLPNLESADSTALNTWRWEHAPFFNRIRDQLYRVWDPHEAISRHDPMAYDVNHQNRQTVLRVTIDRTGHVTESVVETPSGARYLDDEAIRAFSVGGPFPNPPADLFQDGDQFSFLFGFSVDGRQQGMDFNWRPY